MNSNENAHDPLVEQALVGFDLAAEHHIAHCGPCQAERERVEAALRQFGAANREYANRPASFWEQQAESIRAAQQAHRNYAKRQLTWFRREPEVVWLAGFGEEAGVREEAGEAIRERL